MTPFNKLTLVALIVIISSCKKDPNSETTTSNVSVADNYSSVEDFFSKNTVVMQLYNLNGSAGGTFTTPQGTVVTVPANAFITQSGLPVTNNVSIQFKDIYQKSDMLLSKMPTQDWWGVPLKSGGEFFIKAISNDSTVMIAAGKKITVELPAALTGGLDLINVQQPFVAQIDSGGLGWGWAPSPDDSLQYAAINYVFSLYQFNTPADSGSWCNSDNSTYFNAFPTTSLTLNPIDSLTTYHTQVFLVFKDISAMVHVYDNSINFPYYYAPQGLQCTVVAIGVKNGTLYSAFLPITINSNQTINFTLSATTTTAFKSQLNALN